jgi:hypothetical protein
MPHGYKTCPNPKCKAEVAGPRTKVCPKCEMPFGIKVVTKLGEPEIVTEGFRKVFSLPEGYSYPDNGQLNYVNITAGPPPMRLKAAENDSFPADDTILDWAGNVRQAMIDKGQYVRNSGLVYWARKELDRIGRFAPMGDEMLYVGLVINGLPDITTREVPV